MRNEQDRIHADLEAIGIRASGTAVGLFQLLKELLAAGVLGGDAVERIKEAIICDLAKQRPRSQTHAAYEQRVRERMDHLLPLAHDEASTAVRH
ncbi:MAG: hypothetical protein ACTHMG_00765 [Sphingomonas sp.]